MVHLRGQTTSSRHQQAQQMSHKWMLMMQGCTSSHDDAVMTQQHDPQHADLWQQSMAVAAAEFPDGADTKDVHDRAVKIFRIRKKRLKARSKQAHDQHVVASKQS